MKNLKEKILELVVKKEILSSEINERRRQKHELDKGISELIQQLEKETKPE